MRDNRNFCLQEACDAGTFNLSDDFKTDFKAIADELENNVLPYLCKRIKP